MISDTVLNFMSLTVANRSLSISDKRRWVYLHNSSANLYFLSYLGVIEDVRFSRLNYKEFYG